MKKLLALTLIAVMACTLLVACSNKPASDVGDAILEATPAASPSATPIATVAPSATPTITPVPTPTPEVDDPVEEIIDAGFDELYKKSDYVIIGTLTASLGEWNQCRDTKDPSKAHATIFMMEKQYTLEITEVLKGKTIKAKDKITLSLPYRNKFTDDKDYKMCTFQEPPLNQSMMFFLNQDPGFKNVYYPENEPHSFLIKDNKLYTFGNSADLAKSFANGDGAADKGISVASAKKEMGIK